MTDLEQKAMKIALEALEVLDRRGGLGLDVHEYIRTKIEALRQALANEFNPDWDQVEALQESLREHMAEIQKLRQALEQPEQEPIKYKCTIIDDEHPNGIPLEQWGNTVPPKREWVGLTDEEITKIVLALAVDHGFNFYSFSSAIEAKLKEKNT